MVERHADSGGEAWLRLKDRQIKPLLSAMNGLPREDQKQRKGNVYAAVRLVTPTGITLPVERQFESNAANLWCFQESRAFSTYLQQTFFQTVDGNFRTVTNEVVTNAASRRA